MSCEVGQDLLAIIEGEIGLPYSKIRVKSFSEIHKIIESKKGHRLRFGFEPGYQTRGNAMIQYGRIISEEEIKNDFRKFFKFVF